MTSVSLLRHPKESGYFTIMAIFGALMWVIAIPVLVMTAIVVIPWLLFLALVLWLTSLFQKAVLYGTAVRVSEFQFPEVNRIVQEQAEEMGMDTVPEVFILNSDGLINAFAQRTLSKRYVLLYGSLVDLLLRDERLDELKMVIGHELGHHAAGHVNFFKNLLIAPARIVPLLSGAYGRSCELTADRIGYHLTNNPDASKRALMALALGSKSLIGKANIKAFTDQEHHIPEFMGFIHKLYSTHPRMTRRILELEEFSQFSESQTSRRTTTKTRYTEPTTTLDIADL